MFTTAANSLENTILNISHKLIFQITVIIEHLIYLIIYYKVGSPTHMVLEV